MKINPEKIFRMALVLRKMLLLLPPDNYENKYIKIIYHMIWWIFLINQTIIIIILATEAYGKSDDINLLVDAIEKVSVRVYVLFDYIFWKLNEPQLNVSLSKNKYCPYCENLLSIFSLFTATSIERY